MPGNKRWSPLRRNRAEDMTSLPAGVTVRRDESGSATWHFVRHAFDTVQLLLLTAVLLRVFTLDLDTSGLMIAVALLMLLVLLAMVGRLAASRRRTFRRRGPFVTSKVPVSAASKMPYQRQARGVPDRPVQFVILHHQLELWDLAENDLRPAAKLPWSDCELEIWTDSKGRARRLSLRHHEEPIWAGPAVGRIPIPDQRAP